MNLKEITSSTVALLVAGVLVLVVGSFTANGGFQLAGGLILLAGVVRALEQSRRRSDRD